MVPIMVVVMVVVVIMVVIMVVVVVVLMVVVMVVVVVMIVGVVKLCIDDSYGSLWGAWFCVGVYVWVGGSRVLIRVLIGRIFIRRIAMRIISVI